MPDLSSLHEQIGEVDEGELAERCEAGGEAENDVHVEGRGVAHRRPADAYFFLVLYILSGFLHLEKSYHWILAFCFCAEYRVTRQVDY